MRDQDYPLYRTVRNNEIVRGAEIRIKRADGTYGGIRSTSSPMSVVPFAAVSDTCAEANTSRADTTMLVK